MLDAEPLLLVDDQQPEILELDFRVEQLMRADDDIDRPVFQTFDGLLDFLGALEAAHRGDIHREARVTFRERLVMLLHEQRGRYEDRHLLAVLYGFEGGSHRNLSLAEADIATDQAVHRHRFLHIGLDLVDGGQLVRCLLIWEGVLEFLLPRGVRAEREAFGALAGRIQAYEVLGDLVHMLAGFRLGLRPVGAAEFVEFGGVRTDVFADLVKLVGGNVQFVGGGVAFTGRVFDDQVFPRRFRAGRADLALLHAGVSPDAMLLMNHVIAGLELHQVDGLAPTLRCLGLSDGAGTAGQVAFGEQGDSRVPIHEPVDGSRTQYVKARDAGLVDGSFESGERSLGSGGDGHDESGVNQPFNTGGGF